MAYVNLVAPISITAHLNRSLFWLAILMYFYTETVPLWQLQVWQLCHAYLTLNLYLCYVYNSVPSMHVSMQPFIRFIDLNLQCYILLLLVYIYSCTAVNLCCYRPSVNKDLRNPHASVTSTDTFMREILLAIKTVLILIKNGHELWMFDI